MKQKTKSWRQVNVTSETHLLMEEAKRIKGWGSFDEMIHNLLLACNQMQRWEIMKLAEIPLTVSTAPSIEQMHKDIKAKFCMGEGEDDD